MSVGRGAFAIAVEREHPLATALRAAGRLWPDAPVELGPAGEGWISAASLFAGGTAIDEFLDYQRSFNPQADAKALAAFLMCDYCPVIALATVPAFVGAAVLPDLDPAAVALRFYQAREEHDGHAHEVRRAGVRFLSPRFHTVQDDAAGHPDAVACRSRAAFEAAFTDGLEAHFAPLIETLHKRTRLSRSAMWRLVGDAVAVCFLDAGRRLGCESSAKASALAVLKRPGSPLDNRQLHFFDVTVHDGEGRAVTRAFRARGGCCRYYTVRPGELCTTCVLKDPDQRDAAIAATMRRRLGWDAVRDTQT